VVVRRQDVANVVQQGAQDVLIVAPIGLGQLSGLQAVSQAIDGEPAMVSFEVPQLSQDAVGHRGLGVVLKVGDYDLPVGLGGLVHASETGPPLLYVGHNETPVWCPGVTVGPAGC